MGNPKVFFCDECSYEGECATCEWYIRNWKDHELVRREPKGRLVGHIAYGPIYNIDSKFEEWLNKLTKDGETYG